MIRPSLLSTQGSRRDCATNDAINAFILVRLYCLNQAGPTALPHQGRTLTLCCCDAAKPAVRAWWYVVL